MVVNMDSERMFIHVRHMGACSCNDSRNTVVNDLGNEQSLFEKVGRVKKSRNKFRLNY